MPDTEISLTDRTPVWAVHPDLDQAAVMPRSALHPSITTGWSEVTAKEPLNTKKVQAAIAAGAILPTPSASVPTSEVAPATAPKER